MTQNKTLKKKESWGQSDGSGLIIPAVLPEAPGWDTSTHLVANSGL